MKKFIHIFILLIFCTGYSQFVITEIIISPTAAENTINVLVTTGHNHGHFYQEEVYDINNNTITLKICLFGNAATGVSYVTTEREIVLPTIPENYSLVCEVYEEIPSLPCEFDPEDMTDSATLTFSAPLEDDVVLNVPNFDHPEEEISIYPNPTAKEFFIESPFASLQNIVLYDLQGKQVKTFEQEEIETPRFDVSELPGGVYFIAMEVEGRRLVKKIVVKK
tara:strand:- start:36192 stop:36857 length:666 start_codon:yes stop_codon:yes gene_type:complete